MQQVAKKIGENKETTNNIENLNAKFKQTGDPYDYVFVNPQWELIDENYKDEDGNIGKYYVNANNSKEHKFDVEMFSKACGDGGSTSYEGHLVPESYKDNRTGVIMTREHCKRNETPKNCRVTVYFDEKNNVCATELEHLSRIN